ncbi:MAG TPA: triple tyrosine motif-containing protein, partial [Candidatus Dormibacteraeota bacterium]|nr:triple tyrosine motif-containing protein [Candidatus Dormibacteraeota bacterium]
WSIVQNYGATNTYRWTQTGLAGTERVEVDMRDASSINAYDAVNNQSYVLAGCSAAAIAANPVSPQSHGTPITLTGTATCPGTATYRFWVRAPGGSWQIVRDYSTTGTFTWTPSAAGTYYLEVDVRDQGATASYEAVKNTTFTAT